MNDTQKKFFETFRNTHLKAYENQLSEYARQIVDINDLIKLELVSLLNVYVVAGLHNGDGTLKIDIPYENCVLCHADGYDGVCRVAYVCINDKNVYVSLYDKDNDSKDLGVKHIQCTDLSYARLERILINYINDYQIDKQ